MSAPGELLPASVKRALELVLMTLADQKGDAQGLGRVPVPESAKERGQLYRELEVRRIQFEKHTTSASPYIVVRRDTGMERASADKAVPNEQKEVKPLVVDDTLVGHFVSVTGLPIPVADAKTIDYYAELLEPYVSAATLWKEYQAAAQAHGGFSAFLHHLAQVRGKTVAFLDQCAERLPPSGLRVRQASSKPQLNRRLPTSTSNEKTNDSTEPTVEDLGAHSGRSKSVYQKALAGRTFLSVDVKEAGYQAIALTLGPSVMPPTWAECLAQFTSCQFIQKCKLLRETWFGKSALRKRYVTLLATGWIEPMRQAIAASDWKLQPLAVHHDELVYELTNSGETKTESAIRSCVEQRSAALGQRWHVRVFTLQTVGNRFPYFVKVYTDETVGQKAVTHRRELKCVPAIHFCQAVRRDSKSLPVQPPDLRFTSCDTGERCTLLSPTIFDL